MRGISQHLIFPTAFLLLFIAAVPCQSAAEQVPFPGSPQALDKNATLVVLNDSGQALIPFKLGVEDNGTQIVNLSRHEYQKVSIQPGRHAFRVAHRRGPQVVLNAEPECTYYLVVAYKPERSYFGPFLGSPLVLKQVSEDKARTLLAEMTEKSAVAEERSHDEQHEGRAPAISLHAPPPPTQTPGVSLRLQERSRTPGRKGTMVTYAIQSSGFSPNRTFTLVFSSLATNWERSTLSMGATADPSGMLVGGSVPVETLTVAIEDFNNGEPLIVEVRSDEGGIYAADRVYPFPIMSRDGACQVWAELASRTRKEFVVAGSGFEPGERVTTVSADGEDFTEWTRMIDESGGFALRVQHHKTGGESVFSATGKHCKVTMKYKFGNQQKGPQ